MAVVLKENKNTETTTDPDTRTRTFYNMITEKLSNGVHINEGNIIALCLVLLFWIMLVVT